MLLAVSLGEYCTVRIDPAIEDYQAVPQDMSVRDGHAYSDKAPGISMLSAPVVATVGAGLPREGTSDSPEYWTLRHLLTLLLVCVPVAMWAAFAGRDRGLAVVFVLSTPLLVYGSVLFSHVPAGLMAGLAWLMVAGRYEGEVSVGGGGRGSAKREVAIVSLAGFLAAFAVVTEYPTLSLAVVMTIAVALRSDRRRTFPAFLAGAIIGGAPLLVYNTVAWGTPFTTGYAFKASAEHAAIHAQGVFGVTFPTWERLWGVLFSARRGLLYYSPVLCCIPVGWSRRWHVARRETVLSMAATFVYVVFASGFVDWEGGWSAAARHLVPLVPVLFLPFVTGLRALFERPRTAALGAVLIGASLSASVLSVAVTPYFPEMFTRPLSEIALRSLGEGVAMRNFASDHLGVATLPVFLMWALAIAAATGIAVWRLTDGLTHRRRVVFVFACTLLLHPLLLAVTGPGRTPPLESARAELLRRLGDVND